MSSPEKSEKVNNDLNVWQHGEVLGRDGRTYSRITLKSVFQDLLDIMMLHKGLFFTMKELTIAPGRVIRGYLDSERWRYTHPLKYLLVLLALYVFVSVRLDLMGFDQVVIAGEGVDAQQFQQSLQAWLADTFQLWLAFGVLFFALFSFLFFRKSGFNFTEHLIVNIYVYGHITLFYTVFLPFNQMIGNNILLYSGVAVSIVWNLWVYHQTFRMSWLQSLWRGVLVVFLGYTIFMIFFILFIIVLAQLIVGNLN